MRRFIPLIVFLLVLAPRANGQWKAIHTFDFPPRVIYFLDDVGSPDIGFVGMYSELWRTSDAGTTWTQCPLPFFNASIICIVFKNALMGWAGMKDAQGPLLETTDGGLSWTPSGIIGDCADISYRTSTDLLILTQWPSISESSDDGRTWTNIAQSEGNGISFSSDTSGVITGPYSGGQGTLLLTMDGGVTWTVAPRPDGAWQPVALPNSNTYYLTSEYSGGFFVSSDNGQSWSERYVFPGGFTSGPTGCTCITACKDIFVQSHNDGFYVSKDAGQSWKIIGGPYGPIDSRFAIANGYIYAGDTSGALYQYTFPSTNPATPFLQFSSGSKQANVNIPDTIPAWLCLSLAVPNGAALDSISVTMTFDGDAISPVYVDGLEGFQVEDWKQVGNMLNFTLVRSVLDALLADSAVAQIGFQSFVARNSYSPIQLTNVEFNNASLLTDNCSFAIASVQDSLLVNLNPACPDSILRLALDGKFLVSDFSIVPNPAENHASAWISLSSTASVTIEITDALDRKCDVPIAQTLAAGEHSINITLPNESGIYFLSLEATSGAQLVYQTRTVVVLQ